jgi:hypothetical protein
MAEINTTKEQKDIIDTAQVAKHIRADLKEKFPETKFSVRTSKFAGGSGIKISWVKSPTIPAVHATIGHWEEKLCMNDFLSYNRQFEFWKCPVCDHPTYESFDRCYSCGTPMPGMYASDEFDEVNGGRSVTGPMLREWQDKKYPGMWVALP